MSIGSMVGATIVAAIATATSWTVALTIGSAAILVAGVIYFIVCRPSNSYAVKYAGKKEKA